MELKLAKYNKDCWRIEDDGGSVRYMALALTNGRWSLVDANDRRVTTATFDKPRDAFKRAKELEVRPRLAPDKAPKS